MLAPILRIDPRPDFVVNLPWASFWRQSSLFSLLLAQCSQAKNLLLLLLWLGDIRPLASNISESL